MRCDIQAFLLGDFLFLTIPGEPMVEYAFNAERTVSKRATPIIVGYANGNIGYICTAESHRRKT